MNEPIDIDKHTVLAEVLPDFLHEGPMLVEFMSSDDFDFKHAMILTTNPEFYPADSKPVDNATNYEIWCWNVRKGGWYLLNLKEVETIQTWPPSLENLE